LRRLELMLQMIKAVEKERDTIASGKAASTHTNARKIREPGGSRAFGPQVATVLAGEVFYRQFNNRQQLSSYVSLTSSLFGAENQAPTTMIELAWIWLRHWPNSRLECLVRRAGWEGRGASDGSLSSRWLASY
jgi:transposase